jgi:hypothetical protein
MRVSDLSPGLGPAWWQTTTDSNATDRASTSASVDLRPAATSGDDALLAALLGTGPRMAGVDLATATKGDFSADSPPDFLAVRSGQAVTPQYAGGYDVVGSVDGDGNYATFFSVGTQGNYAKGVAITYGPQASASSRKAFQHEAMGYLGDHLYDAQDAAGNWNRPTFDVRV